MTMKFVVLCMLLTCSEAAAQTSGNATVDSAAVARSAGAKARIAMSNNDAAAAVRELRRATSAWPEQPAYWWSLAVTAAMAGDTANVLHALEGYAALGIGRDVSVNQRLRPFISLSGFGPVSEKLRAANTPADSARVVVTAGDSTFWPEAVAYNATTRAFYISSVRHRTIMEVLPNGATRELLRRDQPGMGAILAVRLDKSGRKLWVATSGIEQEEGYTAADSAVSELLLIRVADGVVEKRWSVPPAGRRKVLGDIAVAADGEVYISDSQNPVLYKFNPTAETFDTIGNPLFRSLQGIAVTSDPRVLYVADYSHGILRVDPITHDVQRVAVAAGVTSLGCDGLAWQAHKLICVQNGVAPARVVSFDLSADGKSIVRSQLLARSDVADEPTSGVIIGDRFGFVANSQWEKHDERGAVVEGARLVPVLLLSVPIR
jgi:sugar lactone lactonase YvrE